MVRFVLGATAFVIFAGLGATSAGATGLPGCGCGPHHQHHHMAARHWPAKVVYGRADLLNRPVYTPDGALPAHRDIDAGQPPSWLDGYGTRPAAVRGYGVTNVYGGSSQVWPVAIPPAGGLAVYSAGAYGPGPNIIEIPDGY